VWFELRKVDLDFLRTASRIYVTEAVIRAPRRDVWRKIVDPSTWPEWWPDVREASYGLSPEPHGVGTVRRATVGRHRYEEIILAWEEERRWAYRIERATIPLANAQLEQTELEEVEGGTRVRWILAQDPRLLMRVVAPFFPGIMRRLFQRAMANLERTLARQR
jgi:uncharacterized protein YndB with AHSA1/START domain